MHHILSSTLLALQAGSMEWWSDGEREMFSLRFMYSSNLSARGTAGGGEQGEELVAPLRSVQPRPGMTHRDFPFPITWHPSWGDRIQLSPNSCVCRHGYACYEPGKCGRNVYLVCLPWLSASACSERNCIREKVVFCFNGLDLVVPSMPSDPIASGQALFTPGINMRLDMHHKLNSCDKISLPPSTCKHAHTRLQRFSTLRKIYLHV